MQHTIAVWREFRALHRIFSAHDNTPATVAVYEQHAENFKRLFVEHPSPGGGYGRCNFTPYMHIVCDHLPIMLDALAHNDLRLFSGEATEAICGLARAAFRHSTHRNSTQDVMLRKHNYEELKEHDFVPRHYDSTKRRAVKVKRRDKKGAGRVPVTPAAANAAGSESAMQE